MNNVLAKVLTVETSIKENIAESSRLIGENNRAATANCREVGESIKPAIGQLMADINTATAANQQALSSALQQQLSELSDGFRTNTEAVNKAWQQGLSSQLSSHKDFSISWQEQQTLSDEARLSQLNSAFHGAQQQLSTELLETANSLAGQLQQMTDDQQDALTQSNDEFAALSAKLADQWQNSNEQSNARHQQLSEELQANNQQQIEITQLSSNTMVSEITALLKSSEELVTSRIKSEDLWLAGHGERIEELTAALRTELQALRNDEQLRANATFEQLQKLEGSAAKQLAMLGKELEEPMSRLIQTASETPRAAAKVIEQLRHEISNNIERDNSLLEERQLLLEKIHHLSTSLEQSTSGQQQALEALAESSTTLFDKVGDRFNSQIDTELEKMATVANNFAGSAIEMSSLGEAFTLAVDIFNQSNQKLIDKLNHIEESMDKSTTRSDEQLAYYVVQAREIIDYSMLSQKEIFDELRLVGHQNKNIAPDVELEQEAN